MFETNVYHYFSKWKDYLARTRKRRILKDFSRNYLHVSSEEYNKHNIFEANDKYDAFIVGSDMVWELGITGGDFTYFLDFAEPRKRFSYAASIGVNEFDAYYKNRAFEELHKFQRISVREQSAADYLQTNNILKVSVNIDPTLLFDGAYWESYEEEVPGLRDKNYILIYFPDERGIMIDQARKLAKQSCAEILLLSDREENIDGCKVLANASVGQFLFCIHHAFEIVTGSFHGMIYSLNYNRNFMYYNRANASRMENMARIVGASSRKLTSESLPDIEFDFSQSNKIINVLREKSNTYLQHIVEEVQ